MATIFLYVFTISSAFDVVGKINSKWNKNLIKTMIIIIAIITQIKFHNPPASPIQCIWTLRNNKVVLLNYIKMFY